MHVVKLIIAGPWVGRPIVVLSLPPSFRFYSSLCALFFFVVVHVFSFTLGLHDFFSDSSFTHALSIIFHLVLDLNQQHNHPCRSIRSASTSLTTPKSLRESMYTFFQAMGLGSILSSTRSAGKYL